MIKLVNNKYVLYAILCVLLVGIVLTFCVRSMEIANADYQDILNDDNAIVNFNQQVVNQYTHGSFGSSQAINFADNIIVGHHIYIKFNVSAIGESANALYFGSSAANYSQLVGLISANSPRVIETIVVAEYSYLNTYNNSSMTWTIKAIDLDLMFGSNNLPSLEQCQELFVADYYNYSSGSPVSMSGLNSYAQGFSDAYSSFEYIISNDLLASNTYLNEGSKLWTNSGTWLSVDMVNNVGSFGFRFPSSLINGDVITLSMLQFIFTTTSSIPSGTIPYFYVGYFENGSFVSLGSFDLSIYRLNFANDGFYEQVYNVSNSLVINVPKTLDNIYFRFSYTGAVEFSAVQLHLDVQSMNVSYAIQNAVDSGFEKAKQLYETQLNSYTDVNGSGYQNIYDLGYQAGQNASVSAARKKTYTFAAFLGALFDVPVNTIKSLLDFNFLGFNLKNFVFSLLTLSIVFALIKFILVKSGGDK